MTRFAALNTRWFGLGTWRMILAFFVASSHLWAKMIQGPAAYAVWGFYVLSGYLMTYVLRHKYGFSAKGIRSFAFNRFVRIFPGYWLALIIGIAVLAVVSHAGLDATQLNPAYHMPSGLEWIYNITLIPILPHNGLPVAVASALAIEVGAYILMPLLAKACSAAWVTLIIAGVAACQLGFQADAFPPRYATFIPCLLPFAAGSLLCHYRKRLLPLAMPVVSVTVWLVHGLIWLWDSSYPWQAGLYVSVLASMWVTLSLSTRRSGKFDTFMGDLSYPVYLYHTIVGAALLIPFSYGRSVEYFAVSFALTLVVAWVVMTFVERPLYRLKRPAVVAAAGATSSESQSSAGADSGSKHVSDRQ